MPSAEADLSERVRRVGDRALTTRPGARFRRNICAFDSRTPDKRRAELHLAGPRSTGRAEAFFYMNWESSSSAISGMMTARRIWCASAGSRAARPTTRSISYTRVPGRAVRGGDDRRRSSAPCREGAPGRWPCTASSVVSGDGSCSARPSIIWAALYCSAVPLAGGCSTFFAHGLPGASRRDRPRRADRAGRCLPALLNADR